MLPFCFLHRPIWSRVGDPDLLIRLSTCAFAGGDERTRTADPLVANQVLYQLSYVPLRCREARMHDALSFDIDLTV